MSCIGDDALLIDDAWKLGDFEKADGQSLCGEHLAPLREALAADGGVDQHAAGSEPPAERGERGGGIGKPMQRHAGGDEVEGTVCRRARGIHDLETGALLTRDRKIAPALLDHRRCEVGEEKRPVGIARQQMPAEQPGAAAKLEHAGSGELR